MSSPIFGDLEGFDMAYIDVILRGPSKSRVFRAMIDTGAHYNMINAKAVALLGLIDIQEPLTIDNINEGIITCDSYMIDFELCDANFGTRDVFGVLSTDYQVQVVLGTRFLSMCERFEFIGKEKRFVLTV